MPTDSRQPKTPITKIMIPDVGTRLELTSEWVVRLQNEFCNQKMVKEHGLILTFPPGTVLSVERVYIRAGANDFSAVTFRSLAAPHGRFWVHLAKVNEIECRLLKHTVYTHQVVRLNADPDPSSFGDEHRLVAKAATLPTLLAKLRRLSTARRKLTLLQIFGAEVLPQMVKQNLLISEQRFMHYPNRLKNERDFMRLLKQLKKVKSTEGLLQCLPEGYVYEVIAHEN